MMLKKISWIILVVIILFGGLSYSQSSSPSNLKATVDGNSVKLSWDAPSTDQKISYNIYRAEANNESTAVNQAKPEFKKLSAVTEPNYEDKTEAASGKVFVYYVTTVNSDGKESAGSNYVNATIGETGADRKSDTN